MRARYTKQLVVVAFIALLLSSCAPGNRLTMMQTGESAVTGSYTLILYGCTHYDDFETVAILAKEGAYPFEPYAPDFKYRVVKGLAGKEALEEAQKFVHCHSAFRTSQLSRLVDEKGETLGFEVRPLYMPFVYGVDDVLDDYYRIKDGKVIVTIRLKPSIERMLSDGGSHDKDD